MKSNLNIKNLSKEMRPDVFEFEDIGPFLKSWIEYLKKSNKNFSVRLLAENSGFSTGLLSMILSGKRKITHNVLNHLLPRLYLDPSETRFVENLFIIGSTEDHQIRMSALSEILKIQSFRKTNSREYDAYKYLTKWQYVAIREMVLLPDFKKDPFWIQKRLRGVITPKEVAEAFEFLEKKGLIQKDASGKYTIPDLNLQCREGIYKLTLGEFHRQALELAHRSIQEVPRDKRYILGRTVAISQSNFEKAKAIYDEAMKKIEELGIHQEAADRCEVYHFELVAFPMTKQVAESEES